MIDIDSTSLKYLNVWCQQLAYYTNKIEQYLKFWKDHIPKNVTILEDGISGINTIRFNASDNSFTLEMVIASSIEADGDPCKLIYDCRKSVSNEAASHLIANYSIYFSYVQKALGTDIPNSSKNSFSSHIRFAKLLISTGLKISTLPE